MTINSEGKREYVLYDSFIEALTDGQVKGLTVRCRAHTACLFCKNCDVTWDWKNGPYMFCCDAGKDCDEQEHNINNDCECFVDIEEGDE